MAIKALIGMLVMCLILGMIAVNSVVAKGSELSTLFEDDFSTDKGWTSSPASDIIRDSAEKNVHWHTDRSYVQSMYHSIDPLTGDFKLRVDAMITDTTNNCWIDIGLTDDVKEVSGSWEELALKIGWTGGGTPYHYWYASVGGKYDDGTTFTSTTSHVTPYESTWGGFVSISPNKWYSYELTKTGSNWKLMVYDEDEKLVGSLSGELAGSFSPFKYVYFGNGDTEDWPSANGKIDNFQLFASVTLTLPSPSVSSDTSSISMQVGEFRNITFTVSNNGEDSDIESYLSISVSSGLHIIEEEWSSSSADMNFKYNPVGSKIWNSEGEKMTSLYELLDAYKAYSTGETNTVTVRVKATASGSQWIKYRTAFDTVARGSDFIRNPTSGPVDQQVWHAYEIPVEVTTKGDKKISPPDLFITSEDISFDPVRPVEGGFVLITANIHNIGETDANDFTVSFFEEVLGPPRIIKNKTISVRGNSTSQYSIIYKAKPVSHYYIIVLVDSEDVIEESNETNNEASGGIYVEVIHKKTPRWKDPAAIRIIFTIIGLLVVYVIHAIRKK